MTLVYRPPTLFTRDRVEIGHFVYRWVAYRGAPGHGGYTITSYEAPLFQRTWNSAQPKRPDQ